MRNEFQIPIATRQTIVCDVQTIEFALDFQVRKTINTEALWLRGLSVLYFI